MGGRVSARMQTTECDEDKSKSLDGMILRVEVDFKSRKIIVNDDRTGSESVRL